jgi:hypothetical protein
MLVRLSERVGSSCFATFEVAYCDIKEIDDTSLTKWRLSVTLLRMKDYLVTYGRYSYGQVINATDELAAAQYVLDNERITLDDLKHRIRVRPLGVEVQFKVEKTAQLVRQ